MSEQKRNPTINFDVLNRLLNKAYDLGRENENREERGITLLNPVEEFSKFIKELGV